MTEKWKEDLNGFVNELSLLTKKYNIKISNDHISVLLLQEDSEYYYEHNDLEYDSDADKYSISYDKIPMKKNR